LRDVGHVPGLVLLGPTDEVELITPPARSLLAALRSARYSETDETPPASVLALPRSAAQPPAPRRAPRFRTRSRRSSGP
jgi:hypothetical protein